jgi:23S rRNA (cytidine1920-2'-O)/16S rRNA (cytidine1409-2'-O)-methyltransferase
MISMTKTLRVDQILVERGIAADLDEARRLVMAGKVLSEGQLLFAPSQRISLDGELSLVQEAAFVSRGGDKLQAAFEEFKISVAGLVCADVGASTGGFTDCLLQHDATRVYAIDVGYGILDWRLRNDSRVIVLERTNARELGKLPEPVEFITADVSFISLKMIIPSLVGWYSEGGGEAVLLVKPQFEATREESARGAGVISSPGIQRRVILEVLDFAAGKGFEARGVIRSPLKGPAGNQEYLVWLSYKEKNGKREGLEELVNDLF